MTCQSLISDLSGVESPSAATARMHLLRRFSRYGPEKLAPHAGGPCVCGERLKNGCSTSLFWSRSCRAGRDFATGPERAANVNDVKNKQAADVLLSSAPVGGAHAA